MRCDGCTTCYDLSVLKYLTNSNLTANTVLEITQNRDHKKCADGMTLSWESEKLARTWCHCDGDFCTWKQSLAALRRASETAGYLFPVDPVCHNSKSRLEGDIDGSPFCGALPVAAGDSNSEIICHKTRHADGSMHTTRCRMLCNKGFILPKHAKKVSRTFHQAGIFGVRGPGPAQN